MSQSFSKRGSAITGSAEVTKGCHMRFAEYAICILALLQEEGTGKGETSTGSLGLIPSPCDSCVLLCCPCCPSQTAMHSEMVFAMVKKIHMDSRSDLGQDTICALLSCNLNTEDSCFSVSLQFRRTAEVCQVATWQYVKPEGLPFTRCFFAEGY